MDELLTVPRAILLWPAAAQRLYLRLHEMADDFGLVVTTHSELARLLGSTRRTVALLLARLEEDGAVSADGPKNGGHALEICVLHKNAKCQVTEQSEQVGAQVGAQVKGSPRPRECLLARANKESTHHISSFIPPPPLPPPWGEGGENPRYPQSVAEVVEEGRRQGLVLTNAEAEEFLDYWRSMGWRTRAGQVRDWRYKLKRSVGAARSRASDRRRARLPNVWRRPAEGYGPSDDFDRTGF